MIRKFSRVSIIRPVEDSSLEQDADDDIDEESIATPDASSNKHNSNKQAETSRSRQSPIGDNFIVLWLNLDRSYSEKDINGCINELQHIGHPIETFTDSEDCVDFLTDLTDDDTFLILSGTQIKQLLLIMEDIPKLHGVYILDRQNILNEDHFQEYRKLKGIFIHMEYISDAVKRYIHRLALDSTPFSILSPTTSPNLGKLDQSFMYTKLIKDIILDIEHDPNAKEKFVQYCLGQYDSNAAPKKSLENFQQNYRKNDAIFWYAKKPFIYRRLNAALRLQDTTTMINMAFYLRDLLEQIEEEYLRTKSSENFVVYRGQKVSKDDFEILKKSKGHLLSFNSFLSTSLSRDIAEKFVAGAENGIRVIFRMEINLLASSVRYVNITKLKDDRLFKEQEILFSIQTIFRIGEMKQIDEYSWEVNLTLTDDIDSELQQLTDFMRDQLNDIDGWYRMAFLMIQMGKFDDANEIFGALYAKTQEDDLDMAHLAQTSMVTINAERDPSPEIHSHALLHLEEALKHWEITLSPDHPMFGVAYLYISSVYRSIGNYEVAFKYAEKALDNLKSSAPSNEYVSVLLHMNFGILYMATQKNKESLAHFEKALNFLQKSSPTNHPYMCMIYSHIAGIHAIMDNDVQALLYINKVIEIQPRALPSDHPTLCLPYLYLGQLYELKCNNEVALSYYEKALKIYQICFSSDHTVCATIYNRIARVYGSMNKNEKAVFYSKKAVSVYEKLLTLGHSDSSEIHINMALALSING